MGPRLYRLVGPVLVGHRHWKGLCRKRESGEFGRNPLIPDAIRLAHGSLSTEYVGAKPSRRISRRYFGLFQNLILSPISQKASLLCLHFWLSREMRGTNFSQFWPQTGGWSIIGVGLGYCPRCLVLARGGHLRNAQLVCGTKPTVVVTSFPSYAQTMYWPFDFFHLVQCLKPR